MSNIDTIPVRTFEKLYHFGSLNIEDRGDFSYEGDTLSVSIHPRQWMEAMDVDNSDIWETKSPLTLVDLKQFCDNETNKNIMIEWGLNNNLISYEKISKIFSYDTLLENIVEIEVLSCDKEKEIKEMLDNLSFYDMEPIERKDIFETNNFNEINLDRDLQIYNFEDYAFKKETLSKIRNHTWISVNNKFNFLAILYLESLKNDFSIDGFWSNEDTIDVKESIISAGGLFLDKIPSFNLCKHVDNVVLPEIEYMSQEINAMKP